MTIGTASMACRVLRSVALLLVLTAALNGCGVVAWPVRVTSATVKAVPLVGHVAAKPLDATADAID